MTISRIFLSLVAGAMTGAALFAGSYLVDQMHIHGFDYLLNYGLRNGLGIFIVAFIIWLAGILLFAAPFWGLLHHWNHRGWVSAVVLGFALTFFVMLAVSTQGFGLLPAPEGSRFSASDSGGATWINNKLTAHGWVQAIWSALIFSLSGMCAGYVSWWVAYRSSRRSSE